MANSAAEALKVFGGMYGSAWKDGTQLLEAVEVAAAAEVGRIEIPIVGSTKTGYKPGRESREGTLRVQKKDTKWEHFVHDFLSQSLEERRANRGNVSLRSFTLKIEYDDPDAMGKEVWQLEGCQIWRLTLGFAITDDYVEREYPLTWESETPLETFEIDPKTGLAVSRRSINP